MSNTQNNEYMGTEKITKLMLKFSIPCILSLLVSSLYNVIDQLFIGNSSLSTLGNAAVGVVFPIFVIAQAFAWCYGDGCAAFLNICQGEKDEEKATKAIGTGLVITVITSFVLMLFLYLFKLPILRLFGASDNTIGYAVQYFDVVVAFFPINMLSNMMNSVIRADGNPRGAMISMLCGALVNLALDPIFIFVCDLGMVGAAWATAVGQISAFVISLYCILKSKTFKLNWKSLIPDLKAFSGALKLGLSSFLTQMLIVLISLVCNLMLVKYGALSNYGVDIPIAIVGIENKVFTIVINLVIGIVLGCQPIIGYNMGAKKYDRVKEIYKKILICSLAIGLFSTLIFEFAPRFIVGIFGQPTNIPNPEDYWTFADKTFRIYLGSISLTCVIKMTGIFFQAAGKPIRAVVVSVFKELVCFIPLMVILPIFLGIEGVLYSAIAADIVGVIVAIILTTTFMKNLKTEN